MKERPAVLCVDDEVRVLEGLELVLRRHARVVIEPSPRRALERLVDEGPFAVLLSDMRMPELSGADLLRHARLRAPETTRVLLTGHADLESAARAVNEGQLFRFLTKPCPPDELIGAIAAAAEQHRLVVAERVLLQQTLRGTVQTLIDLVGLTNPIAAARGSRVRRLALALAERLQLPDPWRLEIAADLSQAGAVVLPPDVAAKLFSGGTLDEEERGMVARMPLVLERVFANIPRLEEIQLVLQAAGAPFPPESPDVAPRQGGVLAVALAFDDAVAGGMPSHVAVDTLRGRAGRYRSDALEALVAHVGVAPALEVIELPLQRLKVGMELADELRTTTGLLLVGRDYVVTESLLARLANYRQGTIREPLRVRVHPDDAKAL